MKICGHCKVEKEDLEFLRSRKTDRLGSWCGCCRRKAQNQYRRDNLELSRKRDRERYARNPEKMRAYQVRRAYGITKEEYSGRLEKQNNSCAICGDLFENPGNRRGPQVDHCHSSQEIRGLLCGCCNRGIANFKDSPERLLKAVEYLKKFQNNT